MSLRGFSFMICFGKPVMPKIEHVGHQMIRIAFGPMALWVGFGDIDALIGVLMTKAGL